MTPPFTQQELEVYLLDQSYVADIDPRIGISPESLAKTLAAYGYAYARLSLSRTKEDLFEPRPGVTLTVGLYTPSKGARKTPSFVRRSGWREVRIGVQRYDKYARLGPTEEFALETGGEIEIAAEKARELVSLVLSQLAVGPLMRKKGAGAVRVNAPPLHFRKPVGVTRKTPRDPEKVKRDRRKHVKNHIRRIHYSLPTVLFHRSDFDEFLGKARYHAEKLPPEERQDLLAQLEALEKEYERTSDAVNELSDAYGAKVRALSQLLGT